MQTTPKPSFFIKPSFLDKDSADISLVSLGAFVIVVLLSIAFVWYEANSLPPSQSSIGEGNHTVINPGVTNHGVINHGVTNHGVINHGESDPSEDQVADAGSALPKMPFQFVSNTSAGLSGITLNATLAPDNTMWRYTNDGWRDISIMSVPPPTNKSPLTGVHPAIWTAMLLLSSLLLLIMASSDKEIKNLLSRPSDPL